MTHHILKIKKQFMEAKILRKKPFEVRYNDRNFHVGDTITYTTDRLPSMEYEGVYEITYVTAFEQKKGWVVFGDCKMIKVVQQSNTPPTVPAEAEGEARERGLVCLFCGKGFGYAGEKPDEATLKAACDHEAECPDNPYKKKIAELTEALKAASPPPSREAREAKIVFVIICTDSSGGELSDSVVAVAGTKHHAIAYIDLQPEDFQKTYDIEEYTVIQ